MSELEQELRTIWDKYEPQRAAERNAAETQAAAFRELQALNERRSKAGLPMVSEYRDHSQGLQAMQQIAVWSPPPKTWRDDMNDSMLAAIRKAFGT